MNTAQSHDFPDWFGPMLVKELRQGLKARAFEITFVTLQVILALVVGYHALLYAKHGPKFDADGLNGIFWFIVGMQLLVVAPLRAFGGLTNERKANTLELIFMTGLSSWRIAWGKWASLFFQTVLFVLAVLPYGVLRYFFGGVNLIDDFVTLGTLLLASAVFSALALAISGLPTFARVGAIGFFGLFGLFGVQATLVTLVVRGPGGGPFSGVSMDSAWPLMVFDALLICVGALTIAASTIAPVAENHVLRQRLIILSAWLPVPLMKLLGVHEGMVAAQLTFFLTLALAASWHHFACQPNLMRVHLEPFSRRGPAGIVAGLLFQPGWPSAVLFLCLVEIIYATSVLWIVTGEESIVAMIAVGVMAGAALMTPPLVWRLFGVRSKQTLLWHTIFLGLWGGLYAMLEALDNSSLGDYQVLAVVPPFGFFVMFDGGINTYERNGWLVAAIGMFILLTCLLLLLSRSYWKQLLTMARGIRTAPKREEVTLEVAA